MKQRDQAPQASAGPGVKRAQALAVLSLSCVVLSSCTGEKPQTPPASPAAMPAPALRLVAFDSCDDLLKGLRAAAQEAVGPWGISNMPGGIHTLNGAAEDARAAGGA